MIIRDSVLDPDTITILISDQFAPDSLPPKSDGTCTLIIRLFGLTLEDLCILTLGQVNDRGVNWEGWKSYRVSELLIKCLDQGKRLFSGRGEWDRGGGGLPSQLHQQSANPLLASPQ